MGTKRILTPDLEQEIGRVPMDKTPDQLKFKKRRRPGFIKGNRVLTLDCSLQRWSFAAQRAR